LRREDRSVDVQFSILVGCKEVNVDQRHIIIITLIALLTERAWALEVIGKK
jgi:hypothetical protein